LPGSAAEKENVVDSAVLRFSEGNSFKEYRASIEASGDGYVVNFAFGRIGNVNQSGTKTSKPVSYESARGIFERLINEKLAKGYRDVGGGATKMVGSVNAKIQTGLRPQLLNMIDEDMLATLLESPAYMAQEKKDGVRRMIGKVGATVTGVNRKGEETGLPECIAQELRKFECDLVVDGEQIGDVFWMFDVLECEGEDLRKRPAKERYQIALGLCAVTLWPVQIVQAAFDRVGKRNLFDQIKASKGEGVVFKNCDAPYTPGRPNSGGAQLKYKFTSTATCRVMERNGDKRSVQLALDGGQGWIGVGNVTIPANFVIPRAGQIVEVRYLYAYKGGSLYQPVYLGVRKDHAVDKLDTLKYKSENLVEEDDS